ncbi:hypothetical protein [Promicromonospora sp. AC04]|uniref:hypothetical protein n=1 Tax=Promicromonospora sp. AC04 TaxID=2135723 RepID=UPI0011B221E5|nr:hypothetical protein [Promicromonospora sp. AC04]
MTSSAKTATSPAQPETATPEQLASIIAGNETDWRETIDGAGECRMLWVVPSDDAAVQANAFSCYLREQTIVLSTGNAARDLRELAPPNDMRSTYDETLSALDEISSVDLTGVCGEDSVPADSDECIQTLGTLFAAYNGFESVLDQWKPYI